MYGDAQAQRSLGPTDPLEILDGRVHAAIDSSRETASAALTADRGDYVLYGAALKVRYTNREAQQVGPAVPEPGAVLAFGLGALVVGAAVRTRLRRV